MYQHDVNEQHLSESLNEVVMECVSFVGVDVNTTSVTLLKYVSTKVLKLSNNVLLIFPCRHVAGLKEAQAQNICKYRAENGPFKFREELKKVNSIGKKTFEQCAGFLRIEPTGQKNKNYNLLDSTWIHPESYSLAEKIMKKCNVKKQDIGSTEFIGKIKEFMQKNSVEQLAKELNEPPESVRIL